MLRACFQSATARLARVLVAVMLALTSGPVPPTALVAGVAALTLPAPAEARSKSSSGGYSKPSSSRTPSFSSSSRSSSSSSSSRSSGGYSRPDRTPSASSSSSRGSNGGGSSLDRSIGRQSGFEALQGYREDRTPSRPAPDRTPSASSSSRNRDSDSGGSWSWGGSRDRTPTISQRRDAAPPVYPMVPPSYRAPAYAQYGAPRFGVTDALIWWFALDTIGDAASAYFMSDAIRNRPDEYRAFRAEADRLAQDNTDLRAKLAQFDTTVAKQAEEETRASSSGGGFWGLGIVLLILIVGGGIAYMVFIRRRSAGDARAEGSASAPAGASRRFRVGMTIPIDPTPFLLAGDAVKVTAPEAPGAMATVTAVGLLRFGAAEANRAYIGESAFFEAHIAKGGAIESCRWFSQIDEVVPTRNEWAVWLDPGEGMLHHHEFQTHDGALYQRAWGSRTGTTPPRTFTETVAAGGQPTELKHTAMLYRRDTGLAEPAPGTEYLLVDVVEDEAAKSASVRLYAGIDVSPATLGI